MQAKQANHAHFATKLGKLALALALVTTLCPGLREFAVSTALADSKDSSFVEVNDVGVADDAPAEKSHGGGSLGKGDSEDSDNASASSASAKSKEAAGSGESAGKEPDADADDGEGAGADSSEGSSESASTDGASADQQQGEEAGQSQEAQEGASTTGEESASSDAAAKVEEGQFDLLTFEDDKLVATVKAPYQTLPEGAKLEVEEIHPVTAEKADAYGEALSALADTLHKDDKVYTAAKVYDIRICGADGEEIEPNGQVQVTLDYKQAQPLGESKDKVGVAHLTDAGNLTTMSAGAESDKGGKIKSAEFKTDSFSYFIVFTSDGADQGANAEIEVDDHGRWLKFYTPAQGEYTTEAEDDPANATVKYDKCGHEPGTDAGLQSIVNEAQSATSLKYEGNRHYRRVFQVVLHDSQTGDVIDPGTTQYFWTWENTVRIDDFNLPGLEVVKTRMQTAWDDAHDWEANYKDLDVTGYEDVESDGLIGSYRVRGYRSSNGEDGQINTLHVFVKDAQPQDSKMRYLVRYVHADGSVTDGGVHYMASGESAPFSAADHVKSGVEEYAGMSVVTGVDALYNGNSKDYNEATGTGTFHYNANVDIAKVYIYYKALPEARGDPTSRGRFDYDDNTGKYYTGKSNGESGLYTNKTAEKVDDRQFLVNLETWNVKQPASVGMVLDASGSMAWTAGTPQPMTVADMNSKITSYNSEHGTNISQYSSGNISADQLKAVMRTDMTDNTTMGYNGFHYYVLDTRSSINEYVALGYSPDTSMNKAGDALITLSSGSQVFSRRYNGAGWYFVNSQHNNLNKTGKSYEGLNNNEGPAQFYVEGGYLKCRFWDGEKSNGTEVVKTSIVYEKRDQMFTKNETLQDAVAQFGSILIASSPKSEIGMTRFSSSNKDQLPDAKHLIEGWTGDTVEIAKALDQSKNSDFTTTKGSYNGNSEYEYGLTAQTNTYRGIQAYATYLKGNAKGSNSKYIIIFTDGKDTGGDAEGARNKNGGNPTRSQLGHSGSEIQSLVDEGYEVITVLMRSLAMTEGSNDLADARAFLKGLATGGKDGDSSKKLYFEADSDDAHAMVDQFRAIADYINTGLHGYSVRDYIDPRFDVVNEAGKVLSVLDSDGEFKHATNSDVNAQGLRSFTTPDGKQAMLGYDAERKMFYVLWQDQDIPATDLDATEVVSLWKSQVRLQSKEDFLGGNDVLANGNDSSLNSVYKPKTKTESDGQGGTRTVPDTDAYGREQIDTTGVHAEFPFASVNPGLLDVALGNYEDTIFLGEKIKPGELLSTLDKSLTVAQRQEKESDEATRAHRVADTAYDSSVTEAAGDTDHSSVWYVEYLERLGKKLHDNPSFYSTIFEHLVLKDVGSDESRVKGVETLIGELKDTSLYDISDTAGTFEATGKTGTKVAGEHIKIEKSISADSAKITVEVPYYYLESPTDKSSYAGPDTTGVDPQDDRVGTLTYTWELKDFAGNKAAVDTHVTGGAADENKFVTFDTYVSESEHMSTAGSKQDVDKSVQYQFSISYVPTSFADDDDTAIDGNNDGSNRTKALTGQTDVAQPLIRDAAGTRDSETGKILYGAAAKDEQKAQEGKQNTTDEMGWAVVHAVDGRIKIEKKMLTEDFNKMKSLGLEGTMTFTLTGTNVQDSQSTESDGAAMIDTATGNVVWAKQGQRTWTKTLDISSATADREEGGYTFLAMDDQWFEGLPQGTYKLSETPPDSLKCTTIEPDDVEFDTTAETDPAGPYNSTVANWEAANGGAGNPITFKVGTDDGAAVSATSYQNSDYTYANVKDDIDTGTYKQIDKYLNKANEKKYLNAQLGHAVVENTLAPTAIKVTKTWQDADCIPTEGIVIKITNTADPDEVYYVPLTATTDKTWSGTTGSVIPLSTATYTAEEGTGTCTLDEDTGLYTCTDFSAFPDTFGLQVGGETKTFSKTGVTYEDVPDADNRTATGAVTANTSPLAGTIAFTNAKLKTSIELTKVDAAHPSGDGQVVVEGVTFQLKKKSDGSVVATQKTGADGKVTFANLQPSTNYVISETSAPQGWSLREDIEIEVAADGTVSVVTSYVDSDPMKPVLGTPDATLKYPLTVPDTKLYLLPAAGGPGALPFLFAGAFIAALAAGLRRSSKGTALAGAGAGAAAAGGPASRAKAAAKSSKRIIRAAFAAIVKRPTSGKVGAHGAKHARRRR